MALVTAVSSINDQQLYAEYAKRDIAGHNIIKTYATKAELSSATSDSLDALLAVSTKLNEDITNERSRALDRENSLDYEINQLSGSLDYEINQLSGSLESTSEILQNNIDIEAGRAFSAENKINNTIESVSATLNSKDIELANNITAESARAFETESKLSRFINVVSAQFDNEVIRAISAEESLGTRIDNLTSSSNNFIEYLSGAIDSVSGIVDVTSANLSSYIDYVSATLNTLSGDLSAAIDNETTARQSADETLQQNIDNEEFARIAADNNLQAQIDTIEATQNVIDLVASYAALTAYNTSAVKAHDKIQVINDETSGNQSTIYSWENSDWSGIGMFGPYYTKSEVDTIHNTNNLTVSYSDEIVTISIG